MITDTYESLREDFLGWSSLTKDGTSFIIGTTKLSAKQARKYYQYLLYVIRQEYYNGILLSTKIKDVAEVLKFDLGS